MDDYPDNAYPQKPKYIPVISSVIVILTIIFMVWIYNFHFQNEVGPKQPIPFSHRVHAGMKQISCVMCHEGVFTSSNAGIPPLQTCILCHEKIIIAYPPIQELRGLYAKNEPVQWIKISDLPDYVYFNHSVHLAKNIDCSRCHGNVLQMDRVERVQDFTMGFCIQCHRDNNATVDCFSCHR
ncbi:MAG TPA: cytochrome c3 family protein [Ruminiclostridium sp.]|nr:cytochrome c3 family protein [Ruminiclostridium sp.]